MKIDILLFGITRDIIGSSKLNYEIPENTEVQTLLENLKSTYPKLQDLTSVLVAVNNEYSRENQVLKAKDEIALIPPVSGG